MIRKDDPFKSGLAMFGFQHTPTREAFSNSIEPLPAAEYDDDDFPAAAVKVSPVGALRSLAVYLVTLFAL